MIHYHGTPIGGTKQDAAKFLVGRHALISFAYPTDLPIAMDVCQSFCLDNGAFTAWKKGGTVDFNAYFEWVNSVRRHPSFDWCLIPDTIDGTEEDNSRLVMKWLRLGARAKGVPVWHLHESLEWLEWLVDRFEWVAIGSSGQWSTPGTAAWWARIDEVMSVACDGLGRPKCKLHGLRMLAPDVFTRLPLSSADSTNAAVNSGSVSRFGMYTPPTAAQRAEVIAERIESHNSSAIYIKHNQMDLFNA